MKWFCSQMVNSLYEKKVTSWKWENKQKIERTHLDIRWKLSRCILFYQQSSKPGGTGWCLSIKHKRHMDIAWELCTSILFYHLRSRLGGTSFFFDLDVKGWSLNSLSNPHPAQKIKKRKVKGKKQTIIHVRSLFPNFWDDCI